MGPRKTPVAPTPAALARTLFLGSLALGWVIPASARATVRMVAADGSGDHLTIQSGIDAAASGDTLRISPGTYEEHLRLVNKDLLLESTDGAAVTFLDGQSTGRVLTVISAPHPVILRGLTFQHGIMNGVESFDQGGGVAAFLTDLVVEDCVFRENLASSRGGGLVVATFIPAEELTETPGPTPGSRLTLRRSSFTSNFCGGSGGGIHLDEVPSLIQDASFSGNHAGQTGGGVDMLHRDHRIERCRFQGNTGFLGAGTAITGQGVLSLSDASFENNFSNNYGGGLWAVNAFGVVLERVRFLENQADRGGAIYMARTPLLAGRLLFRDNSAVDRGGAVYLDQVASAFLDHCTWYGNAAPLGAGLWTFAGTLSLTACIVGDTGPNAAQCFGGASVSTSCTVGGPTTGDCLTFTARVPLAPCADSLDLLCTVPSPGSCGPVGYADAACPASSCGTPTHTTTWGSIKARYGP